MKGYVFSVSSTSRRGLPNGSTSTLQNERHGAHAVCTRGRAADGWTRIKMIGEGEPEWNRSFFELLNGIPVGE